MFDGKMLRAATGTPIRRIAFANRPFADAEPEPLTFANLTTKSLTRASCFGAMTCQSAAIGAIAGAAGACFVAAAIVGLRDSSRNFCMSHAPVGQRSAHRPQCRQTSSSFTITRPVFTGADNVQILREVQRRRLQPRAQLGFVAVGVNVMQSIGQMSTQASHSMHSLSVNTVCTSQLRQRCASANASFGSKPSSTSTDVLQRDHLVLERHAVALVAVDRVVVAPLVDAHLLRHEVHVRRRPLAQASRRGRRGRSRSPLRGRARPPR